MTARTVSHREKVIERLRDRPKLTGANDAQTFFMASIHRHAKKVRAHAYQDDKMRNHRSGAIHLPADVNIGLRSSSRMFVSVYGRKKRSLPLQRVRPQAGVS